MDHTWNELKKGKWRTRNAESGVWKIKSSGGKIKKKKEMCKTLKTGRGIILDGGLTQFNLI